MNDADYVIIGAGVAGLSAAYALKKRGATVLVLEARDHVGGRTWSGQLEGAEVDWGGEWIGEGQPRIYALIKELGLRTFPTVTAPAGGEVSVLDDFSDLGSVPAAAFYRLQYIP